VLLLAIDTSTSAITTAVHDGSAVVSRRSVVDARAHGERLAPAILEVLTDAGASVADLTHIAAGIGPGPFTGLRVGLVTARVLAHVTGLRVLGVGSLDALAHEAFSRAAEGAGRGGEPLTSVLVATDARRKEVYWAAYDAGPAGLPVRLTAPAVAHPVDVLRDLRGAGVDDVLPRTVVGRGGVLYPDAFGGWPRLAEPLDVDAGYLADLAVRRLAAGVPAEAADPAYLRRPDALTTAERLRAGL
jgi:tRNA threonylcarbamoyladenosine biosynthesis protein TsaB